MKITFVLPEYSSKPWGGYRVVYEYANHLVIHGHEVTVVHLQNSTPSSIVVLKPSVMWQPIDFRIQMLCVPISHIHHIPDGDAIFSTWWPITEILYYLHLPSSKGRKFDLIQGYVIGNNPSLKERIDATWRLPMKKVVVSRWLFRKGIELGVPPNDMFYIPNGINHKIFRLKRSIEDRPKKVAMMFSPIECKGGTDGIKALELARKEIPDLQAVLFGTVPKPEWLPRWLEYYENPPLHVLVDEIYNGSAIYLCPSWTEGWGLPSAEAMACGCAVVSTDNGGVRDYAVHEKTALLSPPKDPERLAKNLIRLLKNDNLRIQLAKAGNERIRNFTWERSTNLLEKFLWQHIKA